jgi:hypothetical protein
VRSGVRRIFLHFFDLHFLEEVVGRARNHPATLARLRAESDLAVRFALLYADDVLVPAASYHEHPLCRQVIDRFTPLFETGLLRFVGGAPNMEVFVESKVEQYRPGSPQRIAYEAALADEGLTLPFLEKPGDTTTTEDLQAFWLDTLEVKGFPDVVFGKGEALPKNLEALWAAIPERLGLEAFIPEYVEPHLFRAGTPPVVRSRLFGLINEGYFASYANAYGAGFVVDLVSLTSRHGLRSASVDIPYRRMMRVLQRRGVFDRVRDVVPTQLVELREHEQVVVGLAEALHGELEIADPEQLTLAIGVTPDLGSLVEDILRVPRGRRTARRYHEAAERFLTAAFWRSLVDPRMEQFLDEKTRRADIIYRNVAYTGFFRWMHATFGAVYVVVECKNYGGEVGNAELDQTLGYLTPWRGRFAILVCRHFKDRAGFIQRCRLAVRAERGCVVALADSDLVTLAGLGVEPAAGQSAFLAARVDEVME